MCYCKTIQLIGTVDLEIGGGRLNLHLQFEVVPWQAVELGPVLSAGRAGAQEPVGALVDRKTRNIY